MFGNFSFSTHKFFLLKLLTGLFIVSIVIVVTFIAIVKLGFFPFKRTSQTPPQTQQQGARDLTDNLLKISSDYRQALPEEQVQLLELIVKVAKEREDLLKSLIEENPREFLKLALSEEVKKSLPKEVQTNIEGSVSVAGELEIIHIDNIEQGKGDLEYSLIEDNKTFSLHPTKELTDLTSGEKVKVSGVKLGDKIAIDSDEAGSLKIIKEPSSSNVLAATTETTGEQKTVVLLVNFLDETTQAFNLVTANTKVFTDVNNYYKEASFNKTFLTGSTFGWYTLPFNFATVGCDASRISTEAITAANTDVDFTQYSRLVFVFPDSANRCPFGGTATIGKSSISTPDGVILASRTWIKTVYFNPGLISHELGHNLGLYHAGAWECGSVSVGSGCSSVEYGNPFDRMGNTDPGGHFNAYNKESLGWFDAANIKIASQSATFDIAPIESPNANLQTVKIPVQKDGAGNPQNFYYLEFRQPIGFDSSLSGNLFNGTLIHWAPFYQSGALSQLIDTTPNSSIFPFEDRKDSTLEVGKIFTDTTNGIEVTAQNKTASALTVQVKPTTPTCTQANPSLAITPASQNAQKGATVSYTIVVANNDTNCQPATFSLTPSIPAGWSAAFGSNTLTVNSTTTSSTNLTVTSASNATDGVYNISVQTTNSANSGYQASNSATYIVFTPNNPPVLAPIGNKTINEGGLLEFTISATDPDGNTLTYSASNLPQGAALDVTSHKFSWTPAFSQAGSYPNVRLTVSDGALTDFEDITITVVDVPQASPTPSPSPSPTTGETPWKSNEFGPLTTNVLGGATLGYKFTPLVNGQITKLGGFFNGTKTLYLWDSSTKSLLAQAQVASSNNWVYSPITPVNVTAAKSYIVAVFTGTGSGGSWRYPIQLPKTYGNIKIDASWTNWMSSGPAMPNTYRTDVMYGQADIEFSPIGVQGAKSQRSIWLIILDFLLKSSAVY